MKRFGLLAGILCFAGALLLPLPAGLETAASALAPTPGAQEAAVRSVHVVLGLTLLMVVWWITEAIPMAATALLPAVVLPLFQCVSFSGGKEMPLDIRHVLANYANPVIYLFLGGFLLAGAMQKWRLDRRLTLWILTRGDLAERPRTILLAFMGIAAFLSLWISNTATAALMLPLAVGLLGTLGCAKGESTFGISLMLGIAWASSIGGVGSIIGTPANGIAMGILNTAMADDPGFSPIGFLQWMSFGVPIVLVVLPLAWLVLQFLYPSEVKAIPGGKERLLGDYRSLGPLSPGERKTLSVMLFAAALWVIVPLRHALLPGAVARLLDGLDEYGIGLLAGVLLFIIPVKASRDEFLMTWSDTKVVDWGVLLLFGGGIALSDAMFRTGLASWIATSVVGLSGAPTTFLLLAVVMFAVVWLTEITSNTAVTSMMVPIAISIARLTGDDPVTLAVGTAVGASMAFMFPVATPPNALVFGTGYVRLKEMLRGGAVMNVIAWICGVTLLYLVGGLVIGVFRF